MSPNNKGKGSAFERTICKELSMWWTGGERDDVFWRTQSSGGRATQRSKSGKATMGQYGDIQATDPIGQPLINACCIELKIGYGKWSFLDMLDKPASGALQTWEKFIQQAYKSSWEARTDYAVVIAKRDRRVPIIVFPRDMYENMHTYFGTLDHVGFSVVLRGTLPKEEKDGPDHRDFIALRLSDWTDWAKPSFFVDCYTF